MVRLPKLKVKYNGTIYYVARVDYDNKVLWLSPTETLEDWELKLRFDSENLELLNDLIDVKGLSLSQKSEVSQLISKFHFENTLYPLSKIFGDALYSMKRVSEEITKAMADYNKNKDNEEIVINPPVSPDTNPTIINKP